MFQGGKCPGKISQEAQSSITKLFNRLRRTDSSSETVNLMKSKNRSKSKEKAQLCCECSDVNQQTSLHKTSPNAKDKDKDDTFSFTSCSLKKLLTPDSPRVMIIMIFLVGALAFMLLLKCICCPNIISDFATQETRERRSDNSIKDIRKPWEASKSRLMSEFSELTGKDTRESNLHSGDMDYPEYMSPELSSVLDPIKVSEGYGSNNLREFYRKLLKTDIQIKNLKKGFTGIKRGNIIDATSNRLKRSLKILTDPARKHIGPSTPNKRALEILFHNNPIKDIWKKDSDVKSIVQDEFDMDPPDLGFTLKQQKLKKSNENGHDYTTKENTKNQILNTQQPEDNKENDLENPRVNNYELFDVLLGRETSSTQHRHLLQHDDDEDEDRDENTDYEDQTKEPWDREKRTVKYEEQTKETWDAFTIEPVSSYEDWDRNERTVKTTQPKMEKQPNSKPVSSPKSKSTNVKLHIPIDNEINYLIEAAMRMVTGKNVMGKYPNAMLINSTEYFEDNGNYDELVEMAQAYSDYGVLNSKKESVEKNAILGNKIKVVASEKQYDVSEQPSNFIDNSLRGQRIKLKSNTETTTEKSMFLKRLRLKLFSKDDLETTTMSKQASKSTNSTHAEVATTWSMFGLKKSQKHKERNVLYSGHRRSLKSVELEEISDIADIDIQTHIDDTVNLNNNVEEATMNVEIYSNTENIRSTYKQNKLNNTNDKKGANSVPFNLEINASRLNEKSLNTSWGLGNLFGVIADFCLFLSGFDENRNESNYRFLLDFVTMLNPRNPYKNKTVMENEINETRAPLETSIDTEMVDNIGHRSRVLMSFEELADVRNATEVTSDQEDRSESYVIKTNKEHTNTSNANKIANSSKTETKNEEIEASNRTVVKRSANNNVIFWNDLYDDEYGVKDPLEDDMKDKSSIKYNERVRKENWIGAKFKMLAKSLKERRNRKIERKKKRILKNARTTKNHTKRAIPVPSSHSKQVFEGLTANMKRVCHEAAQAIHETTNREVRADSNQATTLMQQLVSLMSELVDLQVREKTCLQLPEDLRSFLAWLTSPNTEERDDLGFAVNTYDAGPTPSLHNTDAYEMMSSNTRSECLGTIQDVEDLIMQYDEMSEEDKSKMSGVREYLENQLHYLHQQLSSFNEFEAPLMYQDHPIRRRRQLSLKKHRKQKPYRFLNYGRKHTKYTVSDEYFTEDYKSLKPNKIRNEYYMRDKNINSENDEKFENSNINRNEGSRNNENDLQRMTNNYYSVLVQNNDSTIN